MSPSPTSSISSSSTPPNSTWAALTEVSSAVCARRFSFLLALRDTNWKVFKSFTRWARRVLVCHHRNIDDPTTKTRKREMNVPSSRTSCSSSWFKYTRSLFWELASSAGSITSKALCTTAAT